MNPPPGTLVLAALISIGVGVVQCFFGYRFFKFVLGLTGFVACGFVAGTIAYGMTDSEIVGVATGIVVGILGAWLFVALYFVGVFVIGAYFGAILSLLVFAAAGAEPQLVLVAIGAIVAGILAVAVQKIMIMLSTAFGGAWLIVQGVTFFLGAPAGWGGFWPSSGHAAVEIVGWLVLGLVGFVVQWKAQNRREIKMPRTT